MEGESEFSVLLFTVKSPECAIYICAGKETGVQGETIIQTSKTLNTVVVCGLQLRCREGMVQ